MSTRRILLAGAAGGLLALQGRSLRATTADPAAPWAAAPAADASRLARARRRLGGARAQPAQPPALDPGAAGGWLRAAALRPRPPPARDRPVRPADHDRPWLLRRAVPHGRRAAGPRRARSTPSRRANPPRGSMRGRWRGSSRWPAPPRPTRCSPMPLARRSAKVPFDTARTVTDAAAGGPCRRHRRGLRRHQQIRPASPPCATWPGAPG